MGSPISSPVREILWYEQSGHEMMQDLEADRVFVDIMRFVQRFELDPQQEAQPGAAAGETVETRA